MMEEAITWEISLCREQEEGLPTDDKTRVENIIVKFCLHFFFFFYVNIGVAFNHL